jgi:large subunit ribosomal protein L10
LREKALIRVTRKSLLKFAIEKSKKENIKNLENLLPLQVGLILTNLDAFKFYLLAKKTKSLTFAKEGDIAQYDIEIKAGPTNLTPGPVIGELSKVGIPVGVEGGKIAVKKNVVVAKSGDKISKELASALRKLGIPTKEIGLNIVALYSEGKIYERNILDLVGECSLNLLKDAFNKALNFSININYPTKYNIGYLLVKAFNQAKFIGSKIGG